MAIEAIIAKYPCLYHMAEYGSLGSLIRYGIESTSALCRRYEVPPQQAQEYLSEIRTESITLTHPSFPDAILRDQCAMDERRLSAALAGSCTNQEWLGLLNSKVFFWAEPERLTRIMNAPLYRDRKHDVLVLNTESILRENTDRVRIASMNTGNTNPPNARTPDAFKTIDRFRSMPRIVEVTVENRVGNIEKHLERFARVSVGEIERVVRE